MKTKHILIAVSVVVLSVGAYFLFKNTPKQSLAKKQNLEFAMVGEYTGYDCAAVDQSNGAVGPFVGSSFAPYPMIWLHDSTSVDVRADTFYVDQGRPNKVRSEAPLYVWGTGADGIMHTYNKSSVSTSPINIPTAMTSKSLNTAYQISTTLDYDIEVSAKISCNLTLLAGQSGTIVLEVSPNGSTGWVYKGQIDGSNTGTLTVGLNTTQITGGQLKAGLPRGYYWRLRTVNNTGTPTFTWSGGSQTEK